MKLPFCFYKAPPTDHLVKFVAGQKKAEGVGRWFFVGPRTTLARVSTTDLPVTFVFNELTKDGQDVCVQGEIEVRLDIASILARRDFSIDPDTGDYLSDDPEKVGEEVAHALQTFVRREVIGKDLKTVLAEIADLEKTVLKAVSENPLTFTDLGVKVVKLFITGVKPANPDLRRALEAEARERMLAEADKAIADRRMDAAKSDRSLREYEADTAEKLEKRRKELIEASNANLISQAVAEAEATEKRLAPYNAMDSGMILALGIKEIATSGRVGQFNLTPDFLTAVQNMSSGHKSQR